MKGLVKEVKMFAKPKRKEMKKSQLQEKEKQKMCKRLVKNKKGKERDSI